MLRDCWISKGTTTDGYGTGNVGGVTCYKHRAAYEALVGPIPAGMDLDHLCRNRACYNPMHLEPVTRAENLRRSPLVGSKTHCKHGHEYTDENTYRSPRGERRCRVCALTTQRRQRAAKRGA